MNVLAPARGADEAPELAASIYFGSWQNPAGVLQFGYFGAAANPTGTPSGAFHARVELDGVEVLRVASSGAAAHDFIGFGADYGRLSNGTHMLRVEVDILDEVAEANESNNVREATFHWPPSLDLSFRIDDVRANRTTSVNVDYTVCDQDTVDLQAGFVEIYSVTTQGSSARAHAWVGPLSAGECATATATFDTCTLGGYDVVGQLWAPGPDPTPGDRSSRVRGPSPVPAPVGVMLVCAG